MAALAVTAAALIVAWTGFLYVRLRMPNGFFLLLLKLSAGALALPIALVGVAGTVAGGLTGSVPLLAACAGVTLAAAIPAVLRRAVAWMKQNGARWGVRPDRVVIGGGSAGGHLSLLAAYTEGHPELTPPDVAGLDTSVCGVVSWYGPTDLPACYRWMHLDSLQARAGPEPDWSNVKPPANPQQARLRLHHMPAAGRLDWMLGGTPEAGRALHRHC